MLSTRARPTSFPSPLRLSVILGAGVLWSLVWTEIAGGALGSPRLLAIPIAANRRRVALRRLLAVALALVGANWGIGRTNEELIEQCQALVQSIEAYRRQHGVVPATLDAVESPARPSQYGWWRYWADAKAQSFRLWVGDYRFDG